MSRRRGQGRRGIAEFGLSFLDVISCGFGAIILLLIISKTVEPLILERTQIDLDGQVAQREQALHEIRGQITEMRRQVSDADAQLQQNLTQLAALQRQLTDILGRFETAVSRQDETQAARQELALARQSLTDEMQRLLGVDFRRQTGLVGGIAVDSEYIIFIIDTSGSMFNVVWPQVLRKVEETLAIYPTVKGIQVLNDMGDYMFPRFAGDWIPDSPTRRQEIIRRLRGWNVFSNSSPVEGIETAIRTYAGRGERISIYFFGDDFTGRSIEETVRLVERLNARDENGRRLMRIHAIGFPVYLQYPSDRLFRFAALMRELAHRNDGTFVGLSQFE
jgi:hypothetical protein